MIEVKNLEKSFGKLRVLRGISETVKEKEVLCDRAFGFRKKYISQMSQSS